MVLRPPTRRPEGDDGVILVFALIFLGVVALVVTSVISFSTTGVRSVSFTREDLAKRYAADAALKYAVQQLRVKTEACNTNPNPLTPPADLLTSNGGPFTGNVVPPTVEVTCTPVGTGVTYGGAGYALITKDTDPAGFSVDGSNTARLPIQGPVFLASRPSSAPMKITNGNMWYFNPSGSTCPSQPSNLTIGSGAEGTATAPFTFGCLSAIPDPVVTLPTSVPAPAGPNAKLVVGQCSIFTPGTYKGINITTDNVYFASGVYYLEDTDIVMTGGTFFAGRPVQLSDVLLTNKTPCGNDGLLGNTVAQTALGVTGFGAKIILGGTSRLIADNPGGVVELYARSASAATATSEGTQGVSLMTVPAGTAASTGWKAAGNTYGVFSIGAGNTTGGGCGGGTTIGFAAHGLVYAPDRFVCLRSQSTEIQLQGGIVAGRLIISASANVQGFTIRVGSDLVPRQLLVTAVARGTGSSDKPITAKATLTVDNTDGAVAVTSWSSSS